MYKCVRVCAASKAASKTSTPRRFADISRGSGGGNPPPVDPAAPAPGPLITPRTAASMQSLVMSVQEKMETMRVSVCVCVCLRACTLLFS